MVFVAVLQMKSIILTGFMGSGKTTVGQELAKGLQLPFVDSDDRLEAKIGTKVENYILRFGLPAFRRVERLTVMEILQKTHLVLATGGGAILDPVGRRQMLSQGFVVWLDTPFSLLIERLRNGHRRLLTQSLSRTEILQRYQTRLPFYRRAHCQIKVVSENPQTVAIAVLKQYKSWRGRYASGAFK